MLKDHAVDFIGTWSSPGHGVHGEEGAESIHKIFRLLQRAYCSMQPATIRLQSKLKKENYSYTQMQRLRNLYFLRESDIQRETRFHVTIKILVYIYYMNLIFELYSVSVVSMHQIFSTHKR